MKIKHLKSYLSAIIVLFLGYFSNSYSQIDSSKASITLAGIGDSSVVADSTIKKLPPKPFLVRFKQHLTSDNLLTYKTHKKTLDYTNYSYSGNMLEVLPFAHLSDFGSLGTPNEPNIFNFGFGNISLQFNGNSLENLWNNSIDLNRVQTERISSLEISNPTRGFLSGFNSNLGAIILQTNDSLRSKPISRIRYYQASNDEGFIDAFFSARVLPRLSLSLRATNSSVDETYNNTEFGMWKVNFRSIYKISDSLFAKFNFNHTKLNTPLNGGIDITNLSLNASGEYDLFNTINNSLFDVRKNTTTLDAANASIYGIFIDSSYTKINLGYSKNHELFKYTTDTDTASSSNDYDQYSIQFEHLLEFNTITAHLNAGYENINYELEGIEYFEKMNNYYSSLKISNSFFNNMIEPSIYGKYSEFNSQSNIGLGGDLTISPFSGIKIILGYSNFDKPLSIIETQFLDKNFDQSFRSLFSALEYNYRFGKASISYFDVDAKNTPLPLFSNSDLSDGKNSIIYQNVENVKTSGVNFNSSMIIGNVLSSVNFNYYWQDILLELPKENNLNLTAGLYYVDTLYNSNLNLKTGFTFYMYDNPRVKAYDFRKMRSSNFYLQDNSVQSFSDLLINSDKYRLDFLLAGRIQDSATFYFIYENILGNNNFLVPYFPMNEGGVKIGISWDFLD